MSEQTQVRRHEQEEVVVDDVVVSEAGKLAAAAAQEVNEKSDSLLDEIDELLGHEVEAEDFISSYIQKGGE